ncbi:uncharacterized protein LOC134625646 [Pelmatolapia mariae]|uniref:uncharacterized protein LOC134625646 n=1 Tax=Pelmatolapia mariae TaxID=158779 RepID=UPI002FE59494
MDLRMSREMKKKNTEEALRKMMKTCVKRPDLMVNEAIVKFCSTSSSDALEQHLSKTKEQSHPVDDWLKDLAEKLADLSGSVKLAGLGALAFAIFIDIISSSESTKEALRCVFAEEKASEVWDQIDECLKRCMMHTNDDAELINNIRRIQHQLSAALTKLKNSMMRDGQMSSRALRAWVNGAAFHIQVRIHLVRLGGLQTCGPVETLISVYECDLELLFEKHKMENKYDLDMERFKKFISEEGSSTAIAVALFPLSERLKIYYEENYDSQKKQIKQHFSKVREDLPQLVSQRAHLSV